LGTHFFQDLMEAEIYPLALLLDQPGTDFHRDFFYSTPNLIKNLLPLEEPLASALKLIDLETFRPGMRLELVMDDELGQAVGYLTPIKPASTSAPK
jgi:hypothetical protein